MSCLIPFKKRHNSQLGLRHKIRRFPESQSTGRLRPGQCYQAPQRRRPPHVNTPQCFYVSFYISEYFSGNHWHWIFMSRVCVIKFGDKSYGIYFFWRGQRPPGVWSRLGNGGRPSTLPASISSQLPITNINHDTILNYKKNNILHKTTRHTTNKTLITQYKNHIFSIKHLKPFIIHL